MRGLVSPRSWSDRRHSAWVSSASIPVPRSTTIAKLPRSVSPGAILHALEAVPQSKTRVLVENTAGAGRTFAKTAAEVGAILRHVPKALRARTGYGLDTCHLLASGYEITAPDGVKARAR